MNTLKNIIVWFESEPIRIAYLFAYLLGAAALAEVVDAQVAIINLLQ